MLLGGSDLQLTAACKACAWEARLLIGTNGACPIGCAEPYLRTRNVIHPEGRTELERYPDDLKYHPEHDWARIDGDEATFGVTWYAQDTLGEIVFLDPPEVGATVGANSS